MEVIKRNDPLVIEKTLDVLRSGGLIVYPTETCYGVGVDSTNTEAVSKLLSYKKRPEGKAISVAVSSKVMADVYVELNKIAENIYSQFLPGPVTVISKSKGLVDKRLEAENGTLGVRIPKYDLMLEIIKEFGKPITSTSANSSGKKSPYSIEDILKNTSDKQQKLIDLVIDAGELTKNPPSTVIDTTTEDLKTYRKGVVNFDEVKREIISNSIEETINFGYSIIEENIEKIKTGPLVFLLEGELGSGKTHLTKGIAKFLKIDQEIKSPTYTYVEEYEYDLSTPDEPAYTRRDKQGLLFHLDAWRIESKSDLRVLKIKDMLETGNIIVIEWPSVIEQLDPSLLERSRCINVVIENLSEDKRKITVY